MVLCIHDLLAGEHKDAVAAIVELQPGKGHIGILFHHVHHAVAHFANQHALLAQVARRAGKNAAHQFKAIAARRQPQFGFMLILARQIVHIFRIDIGRIRHDQVVLHRREFAEQIGADRCDVVNQAVLFNILLGDRQRIVGNIHCIHFCVRKGIGAGNRNTAAAGAHVQNMSRFVRDQTGKAVFNQFPNGRTGNQNPFINVKLMAAEPGFIREIGDRNALVHAANDALNNAMAFAGRKARVTHVFRDIQGQPQRGQDQLDSFVPGVICAVSVPDSGSRKAAH
ncbi:hypothetical protein PAJ_1978 [Pantoea ananatis AJ13355]|uniref:Uncharacterized protein n=1 Tax=Pantoea ananatis (strain AJ13355) TaxID=932677 RepID=A0A0H3KYC7_PANAA|nr:hypothetical protein PAJ_1978 [Pantoea ananatis AJ13355]